MARGTPAGARPRIYHLLSPLGLQLSHLTTEDNARSLRTLLPLSSESLSLCPARATTESGSALRGSKKGSSAPRGSRPSAHLLPCKVVARSEHRNSQLQIAAALPGCPVAQAPPQFPCPPCGLQPQLPSASTSMASSPRLTGTDRGAHPVSSV